MNFILMGSAPFEAQDVIGCLDTKNEKWCDLKRHKNDLQGHKCSTQGEMT